MAKRQIGLMSQAQLQAERDEKVRSKQTRFDRMRLALVYGRQSSEKQTRENKEPKNDQTEAIIQYAAKDYEWPEKFIRAFFENEYDQHGNKLDKPRSASGQQDINLRYGLGEVRRLIEADKAGALFVNDVSRLFRDPDMINPAPFAKLCKDHIVLSSRMTRSLILMRPPGTISKTSLRKRRTQRIISRRLPAICNGDAIEKA